MKKLLLALALLGASPVAAQTWHNPLPMDSTTHRVTYTGVVQVPGATKAELYSRAREWFADNFNSSKAVLEMDDREAGKLIGNATAEFDFAGSIGKPLPTAMWRKIKVELKDGKYRYTVTDFAFGGGVTQGDSNPVERWFKPSGFTFNKDGTPKKMVASVVSGVETTATSEVSSLRAAMTKSASKTSDF
jgi:hypothetical protein